MLLVKKLKVGAAAGVVAAAVGLIALAAAPRTAAEPPQPPTSERVTDPVYKKMLKQEEDAVAALRGTWELESRSVNGGPKARGDSRVWTFSDRRLTLRPGWRAWYTVNPRATPAEMNIYLPDLKALCQEAAAP